MTSALTSHLCTHPNRLVFSCFAEWSAWGKESCFIFWWRRVKQQHLCIPEETVLRDGVIDFLLPWEEGWAAVSWYSPLLVRLLMLKMLTHSAWLPFLLLLCVVSTLWGYPFRPPLDLDVTPRTTVLFNGMIHMFCFSFIHSYNTEERDPPIRQVTVTMETNYGKKSSGTIHTHKALLISQSSLFILSNYFRYWVGLVM